MSDSGGGEQGRDLGAFGYFAAIVLCCFVVGGLTYGLGRENERRYETPASYAKAAKTYAESACGGLEKTAAFDCIYEKVEAAQEQARGEQDLSAQQKAANSALLSAIIAFFTVILTGVGVWFVKRTLDATMKAVEDTGKATVAMVRQNDLTEAAQRPWLTIKDASFKISGYRHSSGVHASLVIELTVENVGNMPAINTSEHCTPMLISGNMLPSVRAAYDFNRQPRAFLGRNIAPKESTKFTITTGLDINVKPDEIGAFPVIYIPVSLIYNAAEKNPPYETSLTYWIGKIIQGRSMRPFSLQEVLDASQFDGDRLGGMECEFAVIETGRMV